MLVALLMSPLLALIALVAVPAGEGREPINPFDAEPRGEIRWFARSQSVGQVLPFVRLAGTIPSIVEGNGMEGGRRPRPSQGS
jgi:hypothetical protein